MKFIITRTSFWDETNSPAEEAIEVEVHWYDRRTEIITRSDKARIWEITLRKIEQLCLIYILKKEKMGKKQLFS